MDDLVFGCLVGVGVGASGNIISTYADRGVLWLIDKFQNHNEIAKKKASDNALEYLNILAERVQKLEEKSSSSSLTLDRALEEPDTSLLLQKALITAASTSNPLKHVLLSDLIVKRLGSNSEDYSSLIAPKACEIIGSLSSDHLKLLSLITGIYNLSPQISSEVRYKAEYDNIIMTYMNNVCCGIKDIKKINNTSFGYLEGMSCLIINPIASSNLSKIVSDKIPSDNFKFELSKLHSYDWWPVFNQTWNTHMSHVRLSTIGLFIGALSNEKITGYNVNLNLQ